MAQYDASGLHLVNKGDSVRWTAGARREPAPKSALMPLRWGPARSPCCCAMSVWAAMLTCVEREQRARAWF